MNMELPLIEHLHGIETEKLTDICNNLLNQQSNPAFTNSWKVTNLVESIQLELIER